MPRISALVRLLAALSLIVTMFAAFALSGTAQSQTPVDTPLGSASTCYFAAVSNGEDFGFGPTHTSVTVQNLGQWDTMIYLRSGNGNGWNTEVSALLTKGAAKTFSADRLGIGKNNVAPIAVRNVAVGAEDSDDAAADVPIGCVAKQAALGERLPTTVATDRYVSGYNATSGREVGYQHELFLPIVQTNCGPGGCWNTAIRVANVGVFSNAAVTLRLFPADDGSGSLNTGQQIQFSLNPGTTQTIDLLKYVDPGWVGSAHIYTDDQVVAIADRYKASATAPMWITNTAANKSAELNLQGKYGPSNMPYVLFAPDIRLDFNGWNTGISVANTVNADNTVNIQYFGNNGNAPQAQTQRLSAHGMTYFYNPSAPHEDNCVQPANQVATCDFVGGAIVLSQQPVAVAVDGTKYTGDDRSIGQAFSYSASGNVFTQQAAPLIQKGSPTDGLGATSGITFLNPNDVGTYITTHWFNPSGFPASNAGPSVVWVPAHATGFVYTMTQANLPNGLIGSALVTSDQAVAATSANVDYQVAGDGTAIYNLYNPCGLYRQLDDCTVELLGEPLATKHFSVRPAAANAWICITPNVAGQDGKPGQFRGGPCQPNWIFDKNEDDGGQNAILSYTAQATHYWEYPPQDEYVPRPNGNTNPHWFLNAEFDTNNNSVSVNVFEDGKWNPVPVEINYHYDFYVMFATETVNGVERASTFRFACEDFNGPRRPPGFHEINVQDIDGRIFQLMGINDGRPETGPQNVAIEVFINGVWYCGQLEPGVPTLETPEQLAARIGGWVLTADGSGTASIDLPAGCYDISVSAADYGLPQLDTDGNQVGWTYPRDVECFEAGETYVNNFDIRLRSSWQPPTIE